jgi:hypothetical protein
VLAGWAAAAMKSRLREAYIGWDEGVRWRRLDRVVNHVRYLVLPWIGRKNLASYVLARNVERLSADWERCYGHPVWLAETFVDMGRFRGSCYRGANWRYLGETRGYEREGDGYRAHGSPKGLFVYPLVADARERLREPDEASAEAGVDAMTLALDVHALPIEGKGGLVDELSKLVDPRKARGKRHPLVAILGVSLCAVLSGARSFQAIADYAGDLPWEMLKKFGFRVRDWGAPSESTVRRVLQRCDATALDRDLGEWVQKQGCLQGKGVALDGKTVRGSRDGKRRAVHLLSAVVHGEGTVLAQQQVDEKSNEITAVQPLLADLDLRGAVVTADAMHTQKDAARYIVEEKQADYLFVVKENQSTLLRDIQQVEWDSFSPGTDRQDDGQETRTPGGAASDSDGRARRVS